MLIKKHKEKIYGAEFTLAEKKAMEIEIKQQLGKYLKECNAEVISIVLWSLHEEFGFGKKRLKRFYENFSPALRKLVQSYEMGESDQSWLCAYKLRESGLNIDEWNDTNIIP